MNPPDNADPNTLRRGSGAITEKPCSPSADRIRPEALGRTEGGKHTRHWPDYLAHPPIVVLPNARREWVEASLMFAGAVLGWLTPLLLRQVECGPAVNFYHCGEDVLCPLFACFGAALGLMSGVLPRGR
jgi:hypothetical protein